MRPLAPDEQAAWEKVAATIRPLSREPVEASAGPSSPQPVKPAKQPPKTHSPPPRPQTAVALGRTLDSGWDRKLRSGSVNPDLVLDLHGLNLDQAWSAIDRGLERAIASDSRIVLLVTGHARAGDPPLQRGRIRAAVNDWLHASRHASAIAAVRAAHRRHGGGGSLYIILRRNRRKSTVS